MEQKKKSRRGGPRPGAGAPKGNLHALKHGRRSAQFAQLGVILAGNPKTREAMLNFARRLEGKQHTAIAGAIELHARIIDEARKIARGEPSPLEHLLRDSSAPAPGKPVRQRQAVRPGREGQDSHSLVLGPRFLAPGLNVQSHDAERRSIEDVALAPASRPHGRSQKRKNHHPNNQKPTATAPDNQTPATKKGPNPID